MVPTEDAVITLKIPGAVLSFIFQLNIRKDRSKIEIKNPLRAAGEKEKEEWKDEVVLC